MISVCVPGNWFRGWWLESVQRVRRTSMFDGGRGDDGCDVKFFEDGSWFSW